MSRRRWLIAGFLVTCAATLVGFEAGRRYPWDAITRWLSPSPPGAGTAGWSDRAIVSAARYEPAAVVVGRKIFVFGGFYDSTVRTLSRVDVYDVDANSWTRKADMRLAVTHANAAAIGDTVWLVGGFVGDSPGPATAETWKYVISRDTWVAGPPLPLPRASGLLIQHSNRLHYFGGYGPDRGRAVAEHWVLDLAKQSAGWTRGSPMPRPRGQVAGAILGGQVYLIGGSVRHDPVPMDVDWVDRYDPTGDRWTVAAPLPTPRSHFEASAFVYRGRILVAGGRNSTSSDRTPGIIMEYDPVANRWLAFEREPAQRLGGVALPVGDSLYWGLGSDGRYFPRDSSFWVRSLLDPWRQLSDAPTALRSVTAVAMGERVLVVGDGNDNTVRYEPENDHWDVGSLAMRPLLGGDHSGAMVGGRWYLLGGPGPQGGGVVQSYDPGANRWQFEPDLPWDPAGAASAVIDGALYAAGGINAGRTVGTAAHFDSRARQWSMIAPMPFPRSHAASGSDGRRLYVFGGCGPAGNSARDETAATATTQIYDPASHTWTASGGPNTPLPLPEARCGLGNAVYVRGEFWVFGGETAAAAGTAAPRITDRVDIYDPVKNRWREGPRMPTARRGVSPVVFGDRIYVIGGDTAAGRRRSRIVEYLDLTRVTLNQR